MFVEVVSLAVLKEGGDPVEHRVIVAVRKIVSYGDAAPLVAAGLPAPAGTNTILSLEGTQGPIFLVDHYEILKQNIKKVSR